MWRSVPSLDKADIQRPYTLQIEAGSASIGIPITWQAGAPRSARLAGHRSLTLAGGCPARGRRSCRWIVEARPPKAAATPGHSRQGSTPGHSRQGSGAGHSRQGSFAADAAATDAGRPADGAGAEEVDEDEGSDKYKILGIVDTTYTLRIPCVADPVMLKLGWRSGDDQPKQHCPVLPRLRHAGSTTRGRRCAR